MFNLLNLCIDEDGVVSLELVENISEFEWLYEMLSGEVMDSEVMEDEERIGLYVDNFIEMLLSKDSGYKDRIEGEGDDKEKNVEELKKLGEEMKEKLGDNWLLKVYEWSVEYDVNLGIIFKVE